MSGLRQTHVDTRTLLRGELGYYCELLSTNTVTCASHYKHLPTTITIDGNSLRRKGNFNYCKFPKIAPPPNQSGHATEPWYKWCLKSAMNNVACRKPPVLPYS